MSDKNKKTEAGVYIIFDRNGGAKYVGESWNIEARLQEHATIEHFYNERAYKRFYPNDDTVKKILMPNSTKMEREKKEEEMIEKYLPRQNKRSYPSWTPPDFFW